MGCSSHSIYHSCCTPRHSPRAQGATAGFVAPNLTSLLRSRGTAFLSPYLRQGISALSPFILHGQNFSSSYPTFDDDFRLIASLLGAATYHYNSHIAHNVPVLRIYSEWYSITKATPIGVLESRVGLEPTLDLFVKTYLVSDPCYMVVFAYCTTHSNIPRLMLTVSY